MEDVLEEVNEFVEFYKRVDKLQTEYESTLEPNLLDEMKAIKPKLQKAIFNYSKLIAVLVPRDSALPEEKILLKLFLINGYNTLGGLTVYLKEYMEAWDIFEKSKQLALKLQDEKGLAQSTKAMGLAATALFDSTYNLGIVALKQEDYSIALEQFQMAESYFSSIPFKDKSMHKQIEKNIEMAKSKLGK